MLKKVFVTLAVLLLCAAVVTAQVSAVYTTTSELIKDDAIDTFAFGSDSSKSIMFAKMQSGSAILGWGNHFTDALYLSVFDNFKNTDNAYNVYSEGTTKTFSNNQSTQELTRTQTASTNKSQSSGSPSNTFLNQLGVGVGLGKLGFQLVWDANYKSYDNYGIDKRGTTTAQTISSDDDYVANTSQDTTIKLDYNDNYERTNTFTVNFNGIGISDIASVNLYAKLNRVSFGVDSDVASYKKTTTSKTPNTNYSSTTTVEEINTKGIVSPSLEAEVGLDLFKNDAVKIGFAYKDSFNISFYSREYKYNSSTKTNIGATTTNSSTEITAEYGDESFWSNYFDPMVNFDFSVLENLTLKAQIDLPYYIQSKSDGADKKKTVEKSVNGTTTTTTQAYGADGNYDFENSYKYFGPSVKVGAVYQLVPDKMNINFGATIIKYLTWTTETKKYKDIKTVVEVQPVSGLSSTTTTYNTSKADSTVTTYSTSGSNSLNIGFTWFFSKSVMFDLAMSGSFIRTSLLGGNATASISVKY